MITDFFLPMLSFLVLSQFIGRLMYALMEKLFIPRKWKIVLLALGTPGLTSLAVWILFSLFHIYIGSISILMGVISFLWIPFSKAKFFVKLVKNENEIRIEYITPYLTDGSITIPLTKLQQSSLLTGKRLFGKPTIFKLTQEDETIRFYFLEPVPDDFSFS